MPYLAKATLFHWALFLLCSLKPFMLLLNPFHKCVCWHDMCKLCIVSFNCMTSILYNVFCMALILYHQSCIMYCKTKVKWMQPNDIFSLFRSNQIKSEGGASDLLYFQYNLAKSAKLNSSTSSALSIGSLKNCKGCFFGENGTFVKSWSKTTVIISHLES